MILDRLILTNFKNYAQAEVALCGKVNCFVGNNGAGKTNLLDAAYYLSFCKSYFNPIDSQNIRVGEEYFALHGHYGSDQASCIVRRGKGKEMRWNKKVCPTLASHIGRLPLVMVSPSDQALITGGSELRRKFIDGVIAQADRGYLDHLLQYHKALDQRNKLLKQMWDDRVWDEAMVSLWDVQLCQHGEELYRCRRSFEESFAPLFDRYYHEIAGADEPGRLIYRRDERPLAQQLEESRRDDRYAQYTTCGPHKDDLDLMLSDDMTVRRFGSQGQQKSFALALKLAQFQYLHDVLGDKPLLLLDDIFDKLDMLRVKQLIALVGSDRFGQVLLTDTQPGRVQSIFDEMPDLQHRIFHVEHGQITISQ